MLEFYMKFILKKHNEIKNFKTIFKTVTVFIVLE